MDYGYGWIDFDFVKLTAGKKDTRGSMKRVNPLDNNWWNNYCETYKPGVIKDFVKVGVDSGNLTTDNEGSKAAFLMLESKKFGGFIARAAYKKDDLTLSGIFNFSSIMEGKNAFYGTLGGAYKINDLLTAVGLQVKMLNTDLDTDGMSLNIRPYAELTAMKNATVLLGVDVGLQPGVKDAKAKVEMPFVMRVKF